MTKKINAQPQVPNFDRVWTEVLLIGVGFTITATLINSSLFINGSLASYFLYTTGISLLVIFSGVFLIRRREITIDCITLPVLLILLWMCYALTNGMLKSTINSSTFYICFNGLFFLVIFGLTQLIKNQMSKFFWLFGILGMIEAFVCLLQAFGLTASLNQYFLVTGTWANPNVTAMFLALVLPAILSLVLFIGQKRQILLVMFSLIVVALVLLKCRTAYIGATVSSLIVINYRFQVIRCLRNQLNYKVKSVLVFVSIGLIILLGFKLYNLKRESAEGRILIWKVSYAMLKKEAIVGYGYGMFEKEYNLYQSSYLKNSDTNDFKTAGYVQMGYNEFLQNTVEGGIAGVFILLCIFASLLLPPILGSSVDITESTTKTDQITYAAARGGVAAFVAMGMINFTLQAIPAMCLFIFYGAMLATQPGQIRFGVRTRSTIKSRGVILGFSLLILLSGQYLFYTQLLLIKANMQNREAAQLAKAKQIDRALFLLQPLANTLSYHESYWKNYGEILYRNKQYDEAIVMLNRAKDYSSNPTIYRLSAKCYAKIGQMDQAIDNYVQAAELEPNRIGPRFDLMQCYLKCRNLGEAAKMAELIIKNKPKEVNGKSNYYKKEAENLLLKNRKMLN